MQLLKITITHLQIIGFTGNFSTQWPQTLISVFAIPSSAATITTASNNIAIDCLFHPSVFLSTSLTIFLPSFIFLAVTLFYLIVGVIKREFMSEIQLKIKHGTLVLLYVAHPGIIQSLLKSMECYDVGSQSLSRVDMNIDCKSTSFQILRAFSAIFLVLYGFGGLILLFVVVSRNKEFEFLTKGYKNEMYYWDLVITLRKILITIISVFASPPLQLFFTIWILFCSWLAQHFWKPYSQRLSGQMETISLWILLITVTTGMLYFTKVLDSKSDLGIAVSILLILLNFMMIASFIGFIFGKKVTGWTRRSQIENIETKTEPLLTL